LTHDAQAYAEIAWDGLPLELPTTIMDRGEKFVVIAMALVWASQDAVKIPGFPPQARKGPWAACGMHYRLRQEYKQRFPAAGKGG
jgi:hypothetical protein